MDEVVVVAEGEEGSLGRGDAPVASVGGTACLHCIDATEHGSRLVESGYPLPEPWVAAVVAEEDLHPRRIPLLDQCLDLFSKALAAVAAGDDDGKDGAVRHRGPFRKASGRPIARAHPSWCTGCSSSGEMQGN